MNVVSFEELLSTAATLVVKNTLMKINIDSESSHCVLRSMILLKCGTDVHYNQRQNHHGFGISI